MAIDKLSFKPRIRAIQLIHGSLAFVMVVFGGVVLWINSTEPTGELTSDNQFFLFIPGMLLLIAFPLSSIVFKSGLRQGLKAEVPLENRLNVFQSVHLVRMALFETAGMVAAVVCFVTGNNYNLGILAIVLIMFALLTPSAARIALDLNLSRQEKDQLDLTDR